MAFTGEESKFGREPQLLRDTESNFLNMDPPCKECLVRPTCLGEFRSAYILRHPCDDFIDWAVENLKDKRGKPWKEI